MRKTILFAVFALVAFVELAWAQVTNAPPGKAVSLAGSTQEFWILGIAAVTPLITTGIWKVVPKIPSVLVPCMTPVLGIVLGLGINALAKQNLGWVDMAQAGALAVFVREVFNQAVTKRMQAPAAPPGTTT